MIPVDPTESGGSSKSERRLIEKPSMEDMERWLSGSSDFQHLCSSFTEYLGRVPAE